LVSFMCVSGFAWMQEFERAFTPSLFFGSNQPPPAFTVLPDPDALPAWLHDTAVIHTHEVGGWPCHPPTSVDFDGGACHLTKQLAIGIACGTIDEAGAQRLIDRGADLNKGVKAHERHLSLIGLVVYHTGSAAGKVLRVLLEAGAPIDMGGAAEAIPFAVRVGRWPLLEILLQPQYSCSAHVAGTSLLSQLQEREEDEKGLSPDDHLRLVKKIGEVAPSVLTEVDRDGMQPIHRYCQDPLATAKSQKWLIEYFVKVCGRAVVNTPDGEGMRPLWHASLNLTGARRKATIEGLYRYGAAEHINTPRNDGRTLLYHLAVLASEVTWRPVDKKDKDVSHLVELLSHGASVTAAGVTPERAIALAEEKRQPRRRRRCDDYDCDSDYDSDYDYDSDDEEDHYPAKWILHVYGTYLNRTMPRRSIRAINTALRPSRSITASLTRPIPISETTHITLPSEIQTTIAAYLTPAPSIPIGEAPLSTRINQAVEQYVRAATRSIIQDGNVHVVGGPGQPQLRPFAMGGAADRRMGICEVIFRAVRIETQRFGIKLTLKHGTADDLEVLNNMTVA